MMGGFLRAPSQCQGIWGMKELDTKVNILTMARYVRSYGILLVEEKQSGNSWGFDTYTLRGKEPEDVHQVTLNTELVNVEPLFLGEMQG